MSKTFVGFFLIANIAILVFRYRLVSPLLSFYSLGLRLNRRHASQLPDLDENDALQFLFWTGFVNSVASALALVVLQVFDIERMFEFNN